MCIRDSAATAADVDAPLPVLVVEERGGGRPWVCVADAGQVHDGEFQALAAVDGEDLDGGRVTVQAPGALARDGVRVAVDLLAQPADQGDEPESVTGADLVQ